MTQCAYCGEEFSLKPNGLCPECAMILANFGRDNKAWVEWEKLVKGEGEA